MTYFHSSHLAFKIKNHLFSDFVIHFHCELNYEFAVDYLSQNLILTQVFSKDLLRKHHQKIIVFITMFYYSFLVKRDNFKHFNLMCYIDF